MGELLGGLLAIINPPDKVATTYSNDEGSSAEIGSSKSGGRKGGGSRRCG